MKMIEMRVGAIGMEKDSGASVIVLKDLENRRALPIWIGLPEAKAIGFAVRKVASPRPSTHDLLLAAIRQTGHDVKEVLISDIESDTFIAQIVLRRSGNQSDLRGGRRSEATGANGDESGHEFLEGDEALILDARPSDGIALAVMCRAPIYVASHILAEASIAANPEQDEKDANEFKEFLEQVKASDFKLAGSLDNAEFGEE